MNDNIKQYSQQERALKNISKDIKFKRNIPVRGPPLWSVLTAMTMYGSWIWYEKQWGSFIN